MNKLEFGDINRFLTSLGLISIGLAFFLPWLVSQNNSLLLIENSKISELTPTAQKIIGNQQDLLLEVNKSLPSISISLILIGLVLLLIGIIKWWKRQNIIDEIQNEDLKFKKIQNITQKEKRKSIENELIIFDKSVDKPGSVETQSDLESPPIINSSVNDYIKIENTIFLQFSEKFKSNFIPNQNVRINNFEYDIIFKSKNTNNQSDRIVEIKMIENNLNYDFLKIFIEKLISSSKNYENLFQRKTMCILIVAYSKKEYSETLIKYKTDLEKYGKELGKFTKVIFAKKEDILEGKMIPTN